MTPDYRYRLVVLGSLALVLTLLAGALLGRLADEVTGVADRLAQVEMREDDR